MVAAAVLLGCTAVLGIVIGSTSAGIDDVLALAFGADLSLIRISEPTRP